MKKFSEICLVLIFSLFSMVCAVDVSRNPELPIPVVSNLKK